MRFVRGVHGIHGVAAALYGLTLVAVGCAGGGPGGTSAWNPPQGGTDGGDTDDGSTSSRPDDDSADGTTQGMGVCMPGEVISCACPEGGDGTQICENDGEGFGPCSCDDGEDDTTDGGDTSGDTTGEPGDGTTGGEMEDVVCYPGQSGDFTTCVPIHSFAPLPMDYEYPPPYMGDENYRPPVALIDLEEIDPDLYVAPNFQLDEIAQAWKGRYAIVQPHAVVALQAMRDEVGAISVNSGYRSPAYNATLSGSAMYSRHMYGDAYDLDPLEVGLSTLEQVCVDQGGMLVEYATHVHCDFRFDPVDEQFYGPSMAGDLPPPPSFEATIVAHEDGSYGTDNEGFDEGPPMRRWTALDAAGYVLATDRGARFWPPLGTATITVRVGAQVERQIDMP